MRYRADNPIEVHDRSFPTTLSTKKLTAWSFYFATAPSAVTRCARLRVLAALPHPAMVTLHRIQRPVPCERHELLQVAPVWYGWGCHPHVYKNPAPVAAHTAVYGTMTGLCQKAL